MSGRGDERRIRRRGLIWPVASVAVTVVGAAAVMWAEAQPVSVDWFAVAPLSDTTFTPDSATGFTPGVVLVMIGLVVLGFWSGLTLEVRSRRLVTRSRRWAAWILVPVGLLALTAGIALVAGVFPATGASGVFVTGGGAGFDRLSFVSNAGMTILGIGLAALAFWSGRRTWRGTSRSDTSR